MTGHITAGDILPLIYRTETEYAVPNGTAQYYADIKGDSGSFTPTDNPNPYIAWRSGGRTADAKNAVPQALDAGYNDILEVRDTSGWSSIIFQAYNLFGLGSRTVDFLMHLPAGGGNYQTMKYPGCKTDRLEIRADQPGGVVEFSETVLASDCQISRTQTTPDIPIIPDEPAVQWMGGVTFNGLTIYPQNLRLTIANNLGRVRGYDDTVQRSITKELVDGRAEMELDFDVWMEDLNNIDQAGCGYIVGTVPVVFTLGIQNPLTITAQCNYMGDGQLPSITQDKQMETVRLRVFNLALTFPENGS